MDEELIKRRERIKEDIRTHVKSEKLAHCCVERLARCLCVSKDEFKQILGLIMPSHYNDITEERYLAKICGFPLCSNKVVMVKKLAKQKYHISTKTNRVYDLTERKRFCSLKCFKMSKHIKKQIPTSPLWLRDKSDSSFNFLDEEEVTTLDVRNDVDVLVTKVESLNIENYFVDSFDKTEKLEEGFDIDYEMERKMMQCFNTFELGSNNKSSNVACIPGTKEIKLLENLPQDKIVFENSHEDNDKTNSELFNELQQILSSWLTRNSYNFLSEIHHKNDEDILTNTIFTIEDAGNRDSKCQKKSNKTSDFEEKTLNFLKKSPEWITECDVSNDAKFQDAFSENVAVLPSIDSKSQRVIRKRIVKERLCSNLRKLEPIIGVLTTELNKHGFFVFVDTFSFTRDNVILKSKQWLAMTLVLLKLFATSDHRLTEALQNRYEDFDNFCVHHKVPTTNYLNNFVKLFLL